jgi:excisionase family DNA binding protein
VNLRPSVFDYTLTVSRKNRYLVVRSPEFELQFANPELQVDRLNAEAIGRAILQAYDGVRRKVQEFEVAKTELPRPLRLRGRRPITDWMTVSDAARRLGVSTATIRRMVGRGTLEGVRTQGGHFRFKPEAVEQAARDSRNRILGIPVLRSVS